MITQHAMSYHYKLANGPVLCNGTLCQSFVGVVVDRYDIILLNVLQSRRTCTCKSKAVSAAINNPHATNRVEIGHCYVAHCTLS